MATAAPTLGLANPRTECLGLPRGVATRNQLTGARGSLLRAPQQVWLAAHIAIDQNPVVAGYDYFAFLAPGIPGTVLSTTGFTTWADGAGYYFNYDFTTAPASGGQGGTFGCPKPFTRVNQAFEDAQAHIQRIRQGRTFVDVINYFDYDKLFGHPWFYTFTETDAGQKYYFPPAFQASPNNVTPISGYVYDTIDDYSESMPNPPGSYVNPLLSASGCYPWVVAPDPTENFFGTDFLHIFCSGGVIRGASDEASSVVVGSGRSSASGIQGPRPSYMELTDPTYQFSKARIIGSYPRFAGFTTKLFNVGTEGDMPGQPFEGSWSSTVVIDGGIVYESSFTTEESGSPLSCQCNASNAALAEWWQDIADDLKKYGYEYGGTSEQLTTDQIVKMIAAHYKFDPDTGQDI